MNIYKKINLGMIVGTLVLGFVSFWYLNGVCTIEHCYNGAYAVAFQTISIAFVIFGIIFFILPVGYFEMWLKTVLSWVLPLSIFIAYQPLTLGTVFRLNMMEAVRLMTYFVSIVTIFFIIIRFLWLLVRARKLK